MKTPFKLEMGDWSNLKGDVYAYSLFKGEEGSIDNLFCIFSTDKKQKVIEVTDVSRKKLNELINEKNIDKKKIAMSLFTVPMPFEKKEDLDGITDDILYTGTYTIPQMCFETVESGLHIYHLNYFEQIMDKNTYQPDIPDLQTSKVRTLHLKNCIRNNYVNPMIEALEKKDSVKFDLLKNAFVEFSSETDFLKESLELTKIVEMGRSNPDYSKIELKLSEITMKWAIAREEYEIAAKERDLVNKMLGQ
jgi:hypothetical protein